ncbi:bestrophin family protein [Bryobacter aggregatus]|uniref:bestrophin family protein n=1 Tax=Bryobacter aggregatus TaxID=360054 RepID=UPI0004E10693|nr:bestrophin family ion channel [Bryobacter aggregatus]
MITYDPHKWLDHFFDIRGSLVKEISGRVLICVFWSAGVVYFDKNYHDVNISSLLHTLVGLALSMLLVFRTNASYDRYWEGRKLWGGIVNETRNLVRQATVHLSGERDLVVHLAQLNVDFAAACMYHLRGAKIAGMLESQHPPLTIATQMTFALQEARRRGAITDIILASMDQNVQLLIDYLGGCERIRKTPLPFAYVVHLRRALVVYCFSLPFALVDTYGWATVLDTLVISYVFFGIEEIGVEIEGPFGLDENDLPLEDICTTIRHNLFALVELEHSEPDKMPEGL